MRARAPQTRTLDDSHEEQSGDHPLIVSLRSPEAEDREQAAQLVCYLSESSPELVNMLLTQHSLSQLLSEMLGDPVLAVRSAVMSAVTNLIARAGSSALAASPLRPGPTAALHTLQGEGVNAQVAQSCFQLLSCIASGEEQLPECLQPPGQQLVARMAACLADAQLFAPAAHCLLTLSECWPQEALQQSVAGALRAPLQACLQSTASQMQERALAACCLHALGLLPSATLLAIFVTAAEEAAPELLLLLLETLANLVDDASLHPQIAQSPLPTLVCHYSCLQVPEDEPNAEQLVEIQVRALSCLNNLLLSPVELPLAELQPKLLGMFEAGLADAREFGADQLFDGIVSCLHTAYARSPGPLAEGLQRSLQGLVSPSLSLTSSTRAIAMLTLYAANEPSARYPVADCLLRCCEGAANSHPMIVADAIEALVDLYSEDDTHAEVKQ